MEGMSEAATGGRGVRGVKAKVSIVKKAKYICRIAGSRISCV